MSDPVLPTKIAIPSVGTPTSSTISNPSSSQNGAPSPPKPPSPKRNPAFAAMGLPNWRLRLPSRNWSIFLSISGSFASLVTYDLYWKKKNQEKWCKAVSHLATEPLATDILPRKLTIFLSAPPGDNLRPSRDHFKEYIKPILVAAALDWDVIEGKKDGDVRSKFAEKIRKHRRKQGEAPENEDEKDAIEAIQEKAGIRRLQGLDGDIVVGKHTWTEYIRGLQEGWLGPVRTPVEVPLAQEDLKDDSSKGKMISEETNEVDNQDFGHGSSTVLVDAPEKNSTITPSFPASEDNYADSPLPPSTPEELGPCTVVPQEHILGFLNTPKRLYRFLNRRYLADEIGSQTAAVALGSSREFSSMEEKIDQRLLERMRQFEM